MQQTKITTLTFNSDKTSPVQRVCGVHVMIKLPELDASSTN